MGDFRLWQTVAEVALGENGCPGPQELQVQELLEEFEPCRGWLCPMLATAEALSPWCNWYVGKGLWGRDGCSGRQLHPRHFKTLMCKDTKLKAMLNPPGLPGFGQYFRHQCDERLALKMAEGGHPKGSRQAPEG